MTHVRVAEVGADHATLVWQAPVDDVEFYEVSLWMDDLQHRNISLAYSLYTNVTLRELRQQTVYAFRVRL